MHYREQLNIIFMRDNGPRRSFRIRRNRFYLLVVFFSCLPFLCLLLITQCWLLWQDNGVLRASLERFETDYQIVEAKAERLENLEELLREENVPAREFVLRKLGREPAGGNLQQEEDTTEAASEPQGTEGPGHEEFPVLDTGRVHVSNVQARILRGNSLRIGLDLRNPDNEELLSGEVTASLIYANGQRSELVFTPRDVGNFRIARFKRTVMVSRLPRDANMDNAQVIIEVRDQAGEPLYRNIYAIQH